MEHEDWVKAALHSSLFTLLFASYGQVHHALMDIPSLENMPASFFLLGLVYLGIVDRRYFPYFQKATQCRNVVGIECGSCGVGRHSPDPDHLVPTQTGFQDPLPG